jgi:hypothetical protein
VDRTSEALECAAGRIVYERALAWFAPWRRNLEACYLLPVVVVLATGRHLSQSVRAPIALHIIYNLTMVTLSLLPKQA